MGPLLASPAVRLRWPPPGEHAAAGGSASLVASPRLRAGRRSCRTRAKRGNGITQRAFGLQTTEAVRSGGASPLDADLCYIRRAPRSKYGQSPPWQLRRFPTATKTRRATLFRRALVEVRAIRHARGDLGPLFASPTVRLRLPPSGEHAAAPGSAPLIASPRRRAGRLHRYRCPIRTRVRPDARSSVRAFRDRSARNVQV